MVAQLVEQSAWPSQKREQGSIPRVELGCGKGIGVEYEVGWEQMAGA